MNDYMSNFALFADGRPQVGETEDFTPPKITLKTEEVRNGGMFSPSEIMLGIEKMEASWSMTKYDSEVIKLVGLTDSNGIALTARSSLKSEGTTNEKPVVINMRGLVKERDSGTWKSGDMTKLKFAMAVKYYKETINGEVVTEIDADNFICIIGGVDLLAQQRKNLGI